MEAGNGINVKIKFVAKEYKPDLNIASRKRRISKNC